MGICYPRQLGRVSERLDCEMEAGEVWIFMCFSAILWQFINPTIPHAIEWYIL